MDTAFSVLASILNERAMTQALAYLLDSHNPHQLGDQYARLLLSASQFKKFALPNAKLHVTATPEWHTDQRRRVDILIVFRESWGSPPCCVVGIEGKIKASESRQQLQDYQAAICAAFPNVSNKGILFLTRGGNEPESADISNTNCPVHQISWSALVAATQSVANKSTFACEFSEHIKNRLALNSRSKGAAANAFLTSHLRPAIETSFPKSRIKFKWANPKEAPDEFNFSDTHLSEVLNGEPFKIYYMFYCPGGRPQPGSQIHLHVMAYRKPKISASVSKRLDAIIAHLPPREGGTFEWGPWRNLWSCGCVTLVDLGVADAKALTEMFLGAHKRISKGLLKSL